MRRRSVARTGAAAFAVAVLGAGTAIAQPAPGPALPVATPAYSVPQGPGVPFPSMAPAVQAQTTQADAKGPVIPLSTQGMSMQQPRVDATLAHMDKQVDTRLDGLKVGNPLPSPDVSGYSSELKDMAEEERQIRLLQVKQQRADLAMKLWSTTFDPRREEDAQNAAKQPVIVAAPASTADSKARTQNVTEAIMPLPKIVSIAGQHVSSGHESLTAVLLVPYVGEMSAVVGTSLPGHRQVTRITPDGVVVSDPKLGSIPLGYGDAVAMSPPVDMVSMPELAPVSRGRTMMQSPLR